MGSPVHPPLLPLELDRMTSFIFLFCWSSLINTPTKQEGLKMDLVSVGFGSNGSVVIF